MPPGPDGSTVSNPLDDDELEPTPVRDSLTGKKAGEYLLGARLGQGSMGAGGRRPSARARYPMFLQRAR